MSFLSFLGIPDFGGGGGSRSSSSGASNYGNQFQYVPAGSYSYQPVQAGATSGGPAYSVTGGPASGTGGILGELFGRRPGVVGIPDMYAQMTKIMPSLPNLNLAASEALGGQLNPNPKTTEDRARNFASRLGIRTGIGAGGQTKSGFIDDAMIINGIMYEDALRNLGLQNYGPLMNSIFRTQGVDAPTLIDLAGWNALNASAPDPGIRGIHDTMMQLASMAGGAMI